MIFISFFRELQTQANAMARKNSPYEQMIRERCRTYQASILGFSVCAIFGSYEMVAFPFLGLMLMAASLRLQGESVSAPVRQLRSYTERFGGLAKPVSTK